MRRILSVLTLGVAGLALTVALSFGAFALAGHSLGRPASTIQLPVGAPFKSPRADHGGASRTPSPPPVVHGGDGGHGADD